LFQPIPLAKLIPAMHTAMRSNAMNPDNLTTPDLHQRPLEETTVHPASPFMELA
jgi:hypothetical protein